jgi:hypothetical protein
MNAPPNFDVWFRGSKVIDRTGKPLVMYHGVPHDYAGFEVFDPGHMGVYFTSDPEYAEAYAEKPIHDNEDEDTGAIYPVFLQLTNPLMIDENDPHEYDKYRYHGYTIKDLRGMGYDGMMVIYSDGEVEALVCSENQIVSAIAAGKSTNPNPIENDIDDA